MTKEPTKADLLKTIKKQDAAVRKLTKALNFEKDKLEASQAVAAAYLRQLQDAGVVLQTERLQTLEGAFGVTYSGPVDEVTSDLVPAKLPWDCLPNPYESDK